MKPRTWGLGVGAERGWEWRGREAGRRSGCRPWGARIDFRRTVLWGLSLGGWERRGRAGWLTAARAGLVVDLGVGRGVVESISWVADGGGRRRGWGFGRLVAGLGGDRVGEN